MMAGVMQSNARAFWLAFACVAIPMAAVSFLALNAVDPYGFRQRLPWFFGSIAALGVAAIATVVCAARGKPMCAKGALAGLGTGALLGALTFFTLLGIGLSKLE